MDIRPPNSNTTPTASSREQWARLRDDTPMTLEPGEFERLRSMHDRLDLLEVEDIYLPLSRLPSIYVDATHRLYQAQRQFLAIATARCPTSSASPGRGRQIDHRARAAGTLARWSPRPKVDLVTTDGFLFPNVLERQGLMQKKGFPESYDLPMLLSFLSDIKAGRRPVRAPVYSHLVYDIVPNQWIEVDRPDILIVEGVNVLQTGRLPRDGKAVPVVSDFFDFSVYIDAEEPVLREWYVRRFPALRDTAFTDPKSYFNRYAVLSDEEATATAIAIWERTNLANLEDNILLTRPRATLILKKRADHLVETVRCGGCNSRRHGERFTSRTIGPWCNPSRRASRSSIWQLRRLQITSRRDVPGRDEAGEGVGEFLAVERLDQKSVHAGLEAGVAVFHQRVGGEGEDRRPAARLAGLESANPLVVSMPLSCGIWMSIRTRS